MKDEVVCMPTRRNMETKNSLRKIESTKFFIGDFTKQLNGVSLTRFCRANNFPSEIQSSYTRVGIILQDIVAIWHQQ